MKEEEWMFKWGHLDLTISKEMIWRNKQIFDNMKKALDDLKMDLQLAF